MRWTVEADTTSDVVSWPEELDDFRQALQSNFEAENPQCFADPVLGVVFARFGVDADEQDDAVETARRIMVGALERAGLRATADPLAHVAATPSPMRRT